MKNYSYEEDEFDFDSEDDDLDGYDIVDMDALASIQDSWDEYKDTESV